MQSSASEFDELVQRLEVSINDRAGFEAVNYLGADISASAHSGRVSQRICRLLDCLDHFSLSNGATIADVSADSRQGTGTNERARPGPKIFGAKLFTHHLSNVGIDVRSRDVDKRAVSILKLKDLS